MGIRLNKFLAASGVGSRRHCDEFIEKGRVKINGQTAELGSVVNDGDEVVFDGKKLQQQTQKVYLMLNKPTGYVTTVSDDRGRATVMKLLPKLEVRVFPVGRLDYDTEGLLLFTNDGDLAQKLMHPSHEHTKTYVAKVKGVVSSAELNKLCTGVDIGDFVTSKAEVRLISQTASSSVVEIVVHEGKNRQIRRMLAAVGHDVLELRRVALGKLRLGTLGLGKVRTLTDDEIKYLCKA